LTNNTPIAFKLTILVLDVHIVILPLYLALAQLVNTLIVVVLIPPVPPGLPPINMRAIVRNNPAVVIFQYQYY